MLTILDAPPALADNLICTRSDYFIEFSDLTLDNEGYCTVKDLTISRVGVGSVKFLVPIKVIHINVDETVTISRSSVEVKYATKPPVGQGLNCPAEVTLLQVWPLKELSPLSSFEGTTFRSKLKSACEMQGGKFVSYDGEKGVYKFRVPHFSKYSCDVEENEDEDFYTAPPTVGLGGIPVQQQSKSSKPGDPPPLQNRVLHQKDGNDDRFSEHAPGPSGDRLDSSEPLNCDINGANHLGFGASLDEEFKYDTEMTTAEERVPKQKTRFSSVLKSSNSAKASLMMAAMSIDNLSDEGSNVHGNRYLPTPPKKGRRTTSLLKSAWSEEISMDATESTKETEQNALPQFLQHLRTNLKPVKPLSLKHGSHTKSGGVEVKKNFIPIPQSAIPTPVMPPIKEIKFLSVESDDYEDVFSSIRPIRRVPAPRVCFASNGSFLTIENLVTSTGFKGQVRLSKFQSYANREEAHPLSLSFRKILTEQMTLQLKQGGVLFAEFIRVLEDQLKNTSVPATRKAIVEELTIWQLCEILWPAEVSDETVRQDLGFQLTQRVNLSNWLVANGHVLFGPLYDGQDRSLPALMRKGQLPEAIDAALAQGNDLLSILLAVETGPLGLISCEEVYESFEFYPGKIPQALFLRDGFFSLDDLTAERVSSFSSHDWLQYFAIYIWFYGQHQNQTFVPVYTAVPEFEYIMRAIGLDDDMPLPQTFDSSAASLCVHLLKLYSCTGYPMKEVLDPRTWTSDCLDYKLSWLLMMNLQQIGYVADMELFNSVCQGFAGQLEQIGFVQWAHFVIQCEPPECEDEETEELVVRLKEVHCSRLLEKYLDSGDTRLSLERFLVEELQLDESRIYSVKCFKASADQRFDRCMSYLLTCKQFQDAFEVWKACLKVHGMELLDNKMTAFTGNMMKFLDALSKAPYKVNGWEVHGAAVMSFTKLTKPNLVPNTHSSQPEERAEKWVIELLEAIVKYVPSSNRERVFLLELCLRAQKLVQLILVDPGLDEDDKMRIKISLLAFIETPIPTEYFDGLRGFINHVLLS